MIIVAIEKCMALLKSDLYNSMKFNIRSSLWDFLRSPANSVGGGGGRADRLAERHYISA